jgi:outer membrane biosynthesis protein TonB
MTTDGAGGAARALTNELRQLAEPAPLRCLVATSLALAVHLALGALAAGAPHEPAPTPPPVDVELAFREPPPPAPTPEPTPEPRADTPEPAPPPPAPKAVAARPAPPPPAAKAGAVMTAPAEPTPARGAPEPFDFTSDPNSPVYGSGVVAVGGTASHGLAGARVGGTGRAPAPSARSGDALTAASDLSQKPRLRSADPCRGYFPPAARDDVAVVSVRVVIGKNGAVSNADVVSESPAGQGFGFAARRCMSEQTFTPALDRSGSAAATALNVNVRFSR